MNLSHTYSINKLAYTIKYLLPFFALTLLVSCNHGENKSGDEDNIAGESTEAESSLIITQTQFQASSMALGNPVEHRFQQKIAANGYIKASPSGDVIVSSLVSGQVSEIRVSSGEKVAAGQVLLNIKSQEAINLQQEYAESYAALQLAKSTLERNKALSSENITAKKELERSESEFNSLKAKTQGLKAKLELLNLNPEKVRQGNFSSILPIISPVSGYTGNFQIKLGSYLEPNTQLMKVLDPDRLQLYIYVFKKDIDSLMVGQKVQFKDPDKMEEIHYAELKMLGKNIDENTKTIECIASISAGDKALFRNGTFVETEIIACERDALALPAEALIEEDNKYYVLQKSGKNNEGLTFKKIPVEVGEIQSDYAELLSIGLKDIIVKGVYNLTGN